MTFRADITFMQKAICCVLTLYFNPASEIYLFSLFVMKGNFAPCSMWYYNYRDKITLYVQCHKVLVIYFTIKKPTFS